MAAVIGGVRAPVVAGVVSAAAEIGAVGWAIADRIMEPGDGGANIGLGMALMAALPVSYATGAYALVGARRLTGIPRATAITTAGIGMTLATGVVGTLAYGAIQIARETGA